MNMYNDDIINLPHHVSEKRPHMPISSRAAQFSSFAALTGYEDAVAETARLTDKKLILTEEERAVLDMRMLLLAENLEKRPVISVTYFIPDKKKTGGSYEAISGSLRRIDEYEKALIFTDGTEISLDDIHSVSSELFAEYGI